MNNVEVLNSFNELFNVAKSVIVPVVSLLGGWVLLYIKKYIKRTLEMAEATNELNYLQKMNEIRDQVLKEIDKTVKSAVASNMDKAKRMKQELGYLSDEQIAQLNANAMELIMASLPASLTESDGTLLNVIGGFDKLKVIIKNYMEQYVYEYKQGDCNKQLAEQEEENIEDESDDMIERILDAIKDLSKPDIDYCCKEETSVKNTLIEPEPIHLKF